MSMASEGLNLAAIIFTLYRNVRFVIRNGYNEHALKVFPFLAMVVMASVFVSWPISALCNIFKALSYSLLFIGYKRSNQQLTFFSYWLLYHRATHHFLEWNFKLCSFCFFFVIYRFSSFLPSTKQTTSKFLTFK